MDRREPSRREILSALSIGGASLLAPSFSAQAREPRTATRGVVAAGSQAAADAGVEMLRSGGNAVDAAVAAALAMTVVDPANTSIAGRCHIVIAPASGQAFAIDGRSAVPAAWTGGDKAEGLGAVPVGGNLKSFEQALQSHGRLSLADVAAPSIKLAESGFVIRSNLARVWARQASELAKDAHARALFLRPDGEPPRYGETFRQPELAETLRLYARSGSAGVTAGTAADDLALLHAAGSKANQADIVEYRPLDAEWLGFRYRGWKIWTIGRQGYGYLLQETLSILEGFDLASIDDARRWATMLLAQRLAFRDRAVALGTAPEALQAAAHVGKLREELRNILASSGAARYFNAPPPPERGDTTHLSVVDGSGLAVALTQSIGPHFGAAAASPHGYLFAHSYQMASGRRTSPRDVTAMLPVVLEAPDGARVALGAAGSDRIPGAVIRAIVHSVDLGMRPQQAVMEPALVIHDGHVQASAELEAATLHRLEQWGFPLRLVARFEGEHFGLLHVARSDSGGASFSAAADSYWDGGTASI